MNVVLSEQSGGLASYSTVTQEAVKEFRTVVCRQRQALLFKQHTIIEAVFCVVVVVAVDSVVFTETVAT